ncbi:hypothetical protein BBJ28_00007747 [Nothophytophthora sp. Chile5]|nr:hypothetical protein BBJ28_00007747 [Nothophytophthora sp. Chile5]
MGGAVDRLGSPALSEPPPRLLIGVPHPRHLGATLYAGDTIAYYSMAFVAGDPRGYREAVLVKVDASPGEDDNPIKITTSENIQPTQMITKIYERDGKPVQGLWRKLRTFTVVSGEFEAQSDHSRFAQTVNSIIGEIFSGRMGLGPAIHDKISLRSSELPVEANSSSIMPPHASTKAARSFLKGAVDVSDMEYQAEYVEKTPAATAKSASKASTRSKIVADKKRSGTRSSQLATPARSSTDAVNPRAGARREDTGNRSSATSASKKSITSKSRVDRKRSSTAHKPLMSPTEPLKDTATRRQGGGSEDAGKRPSARDMDESESSCGRHFEIVSSGDEASEALRGLVTLALVAVKRCGGRAKASSSLREGDGDVGQGGTSERGDGSRLECEETVEDNEAALQEGGAPELSGPVDVEALNDYLATIPTCTDWAKIRRQAKKRACGWIQPRSRKKRCQKKAAITRSGTKIHHAHTVKVKKMQDLLKLVGMSNKLSAVRHFRPTFMEPTPPRNKHTQINVSQTYVMEGVAWPDWVVPITENIIPPGLRFDDIGDGEACKCQGDCFADTCENANALHESQPEEAKKHNSGYPMLLNEKAKRGRFVYIEAVKRGSIARFFQHGCKPNVEFVKMQNRSNVKVLARMTESVRAGAQIVVHYGDEIWFNTPNQ